VRSIRGGVGEPGRYGRINESPVEESDALGNAKMRFAEVEPLDRNQLRMYIDTLIRLGENYLSEDEILSARNEFDEARQRYEEALQARFLSESADLSRLYAGLGDIEYYNGGDLDRALRLYDRAVAGGYSYDDDVEYKRGYIHYFRGRYDEAVAHFFEVGAENPLAASRNVLYARANTLYQRGNYFAAEAFYRRLLEGLVAERDHIQTLLVDEDPVHRSLVEYLVRVRNNLGVTLYRISEKDSTRSAQFSEALYYLQESAELADNYLRDEETGVRALSRNLAYLNTREILYPQEEFEPQIHAALPRDTKQVLF